MNLRTLATFAIAIFLGLIAVVMVRGVLNSKVARVGSDANTSAMTPVVVAALPIERGASLKPAMLKVVSYPRDAVPVGAYQTIAQVASSANARTAVRSMGANEPVLPAKLSGAGGKTNLSGTLTPGMRAVSVRADDVTGVGGFVLPGDRVDILLTRTVGGGDSATTLTQVLAENSLVLGVDQSSDVEADKPVVAKAVTVEVTPDQAQTISLAHAVGSVSLSLRQVSDTSALTRKTTSVFDLGGPGLRKASVGAGGGGKPRAKTKMGPAPMQVHVTRGVETIGYPVSGG
jgi:pilus assembly protein CpaB